MITEKMIELQVLRQEDVVSVRQSVRSFALEIGLSLIDQTKVVTAASELARNTLVHGGGGQALIEVVQERGRRGLRLIFADSGPGIANVESPMLSCSPPGGVWGRGWGGAKRLSNEFSIESQPGAGTLVTIIRWKG
jgi:serine/threonine-protein kinase RsbT